MEWKKVKISEVAKFSQGMQVPVENQFYESGSDRVRFIRIVDFTSNWTQQPRYVKRDDKYIVSADDIVMIRYGTPGKVFKGHSGIIANNMFKISVNENLLDKNFAYWYLLQDSVYNQLMAMQSSSTMPAISFGMLKFVDISLPPLPIQRRIADILSSLDAQIENNNRINANLEAQAQALFKSWFVDFEPWGGVMPEGWKEGNAEDFFEINIGKTPPRKEKQWFSTSPTDKIWVSISDLGACGTFIGDSSEYLTLEAIKKHNIILVPQNTVLLSFKLTIGRVAIASKELTTNEAIARFILPNMECREFLYLCLKQYDYNCLGSTSSIATAVNSKIIKAMKMIMPTQSVLRDFSKHTAFLFEQILVNQQQSARLAALRDTLLPKLMKGEIEL